MKAIVIIYHDDVLGKDVTEVYQVSEDRLSDRLTYYKACAIKAVKEGFESGHRFVVVDKFRLYSC